MERFENSSVQGKYGEYFEFRTAPGGAQYDSESVVRVRDVLFLCHAKPKGEAQAALWKKLVENTLASPDTWVGALSAGKDKRENFERLLRKGKLGGLAALRNLRLMLASGSIRASHQCCRSVS